MNRKRMLTAAVIFLLCMFLTACQKAPVDNAEAYGDIIAGLGDEEAYAFLVMDRTNHVLVTSDRIFDTDTAKQGSACCSVYYYLAGETKNAGRIAGDETSRPLKFSKSGIYAASEHSVEKYAVSDKDGLLHLECGIYETFDASGKVSYKMVKGSRETASSETEYKNLMKEYDESQIIHFSYGASGSVNEILW